MRKSSKRIALTIAGIAIVVVFLFPLYWMVTTSLKSNAELFASPPLWFPPHPSFAAYRTAIFSNPQMVVSIGNSFIISIGATILTLVLAAPAAYGFARMRLRWSGLLLLPFLIAQLLPTINLAVPMFALFSRIGLVNSQFGLILGDTVMNLPFAVIVLRPFYVAIPAELEEAAAIDGCNRFVTFLRVMLPVVRPGLFTVTAFSFVMTWGEFALGLSLATQPAVQPVTVALSAFVGQYGTEWAPLMATATVVAIPIVVLFAAFQKYITGGMAAGSVKE